MMATYVIISILVIGLCIGAYFLFKYNGLDCQFCANLKATPFKDLPFDKQEKLLQYFKKYEKRSPDTAAIFVCCDCNTVYDDFSGEKNSREADAGPLGCKTICKVCGHMVNHCEIDNPDIHCDHCGTHYSWEVHDGSGYRILTPPQDAKILKECPCSLLSA